MIPGLDDLLLDLKQGKSPNVSSETRELAKQAILEKGKMPTNEQLKKLAIDMCQEELKNEKI